jgi:hypothetical protein
LKQSTNNDEFHDLLHIASLSVLTNLTASLAPPNKKETEESQAFQEAVREALQSVKPEEGTPFRWYELLAGGIKEEVRVNTTGLNSVYSDFKNRIWRICEFGIHNPDEFFQKYKQGKP